MSLPVLAITLGDVAGIGPEITAKSLLGHDDLREKCVPVVIGDLASVRRGVEAVGGKPRQFERSTRLLKLATFQAPWRSFRSVRI